MEERNYLNEFGPDYEIPAEILALIDSDLAFDMSNHNDSAPSFGIAKHDGPVTTLWVEHPDSEKREMQAAREERFIIASTIFENTVESYFTGDPAEAVNLYLAAMFLDCATLCVLEYTSAMDEDDAISACGQIKRDTSVMHDTCDANVLYHDVLVSVGLIPEHVDVSSDCYAVIVNNMTDRLFDAADRVLQELM